jgi:hypothetical protein
MLKITNRVKVRSFVIMWGIYSYIVFWTGSSDYQFLKKQSPPYRYYNCKEHFLHVPAFMARTSHSHSVHKRRITYFCITIFPTREQ